MTARKANFIRTTGVALATLVALAAAGNAAAVDDLSGNPIPNTSPSSTTALAPGGAVVGTPLAEPSAPGACPAGPGDPVLQSPLSPEEDLALTLDRLAAAPTAGSTAATMYQRAIDILEGNPGLTDALTPSRDALYAGMSLLRPTGEVQDIAPGDTVRVRVVRHGEHVATDTAALRFHPSLMNTPFSIEYTFVELGGASGGIMSPTPLLRDGTTPVGALNSIAMRMGLPETDTGRSTSSRFTVLTRGAGACTAAEHTRLATRTVTVQMPPPRNLKGILDPNLRLGHEGAAVMRVEQDPDPGVAPPATSLAFTDMAAISPERQIWDGLKALALPLNTVPRINAAKTAAANARALTGPMRTKGKLPPGIAASPDSTVTLAFVNNELYSSAKAIHAPAGENIPVRVWNRDAVPHTLEALSLHGSRRDFGPLDWGEFDWETLATRTIAPGDFVDLQIDAKSGTFGLWFGDSASGSQASYVVQVDRGDRIEGFRFENAFDMPLHNALGPDGSIWVTIPGSDSIGRLTPASRLADSTFERYLIPGGLHDGQAPEPLFAPLDLAVDHNGIVWVTLPAGNAIARVDPAQVQANTGNGIRIYDLEPCTPATCAVPPPPAPITALTRDPLQIAVHPDGEGNTVVWFTEASADAIGVMRATPAGDPLSSDGSVLPDDNAAFDIPCKCEGPLGISLDPAGAVWFTAAVTNTLGRLVPNQARPFSSSSATVDHYGPLPNPVTVVDPELKVVVLPDGRRIAVPVNTVLPHSVHVDAQGRVWWTELETSRVGVMDPAQARPGTANGMVQHPLPTNEFGGRPQPADLSTDRAGRAYVADEYGDAIAAVTAAGGYDRAWRPLERQSLTDKPMSDHLGNLYFMEAGAGLLTRVRGVTAGVPLPAAPARYTADLSGNSVSGENVREMTSVTVEVLRNGAVVSRGSAPVTAGAFTVAPGAWQLLSGDDPVHAGDTVRIVPQGANAPASFTFPAATLTFTVNGATVAGTATNAGLAVHGRVHVDGPFGAGSGGVNASTAAFSVALPAAATPTGPGAVSHSRGLPVGIVRTSIGLAGEPPLGSGLGPAATPGTGPAPGGATPSAAALACASRQWITRSGARWIIPLLGRTPKGVVACAGAPSAKARNKAKKTETWTYGKAMLVTFTKGRVTNIAILTKRFRGNPPPLTVGRRLPALKSLPTVARPAARRAVIKYGAGYADIRFVMKGSVITKITVGAVTRAAIDAEGRKLAAGTR